MPAPMIPILSSDTFPYRPSAQIAQLSEALEKVTAADLRKIVETISFPRPYSDIVANENARDYIATHFKDSGYRAEFVGKWNNVMALSGTARRHHSVLIGAHYDSVENSPGADDNGSAVAAMLVAARVLKHAFPELPAIFVAFNREEDGLIGSKDFVQETIPNRGLMIKIAHILEMIGFSSSLADSQDCPRGLPINLGHAGDFLGLVGREVSTVQSAFRATCQYVPDLRLKAMIVPPVGSNLPADLFRSDHASFWSAGIDAIEWTDTANFRNPNYHKTSDTPDTLDYEFLCQATQSVIATCVFHGLAG